MKIITIGTLKITLPALITAVCGLVISIALLFIMPQMWHMSLFVAGAFLVGAYNVNCSIVGQCNAWAWVLTVFYIIYTVVIVGIMLLRRQMLIDAINMKKK